MKGTMAEWIRLEYRMQHTFTFIYFRDNNAISSRQVTEHEQVIPFTHTCLHVVAEINVLNNLGVNLFL